jgi:hypothetical protein
MSAPRPEESAKGQKKDLKDAYQSVNECEYGARRN